MIKTKQILDAKTLQKDFPILQRTIKGKKLVYLDNAATTQKPKSVIHAMADYYMNYNANVHRGIYTISEEATLAYEQAHQKTAAFIGASSFEEVVFTRNATESLNLLAVTQGMKLRPKDEIVLSRMEHHSNLVPWQQVARKTGAKLKFIELTEDGQLENLDVIGPKTKIVSVVHMSNVLGTINPVEEIGKIAHENDALFIVDGAQSVPHFKVDVQKIDADFMVFSGHKMLGPTGIGVLYGKKELLEKSEPFLYGGDMIREVRYEGATWNDLPWKFEAGTPHIAGGIGLSKAIDYLNRLGMDRIEAHEKQLTGYALDKLQEVEGVCIYGPSAEHRGGVISFNVGKVHPHDVASVLNDSNIAIRGGHHCAMPLMGLLGVSGTSRASFYFYNTFEDVDKLVEGLHRVHGVFS